MYSRYADELLRAIGRACPSLARLSLAGTCVDELRPWMRSLSLRRLHRSVGLYHEDGHVSTAAGWEVLLSPPRGLYSLDLGHALLSRGSLAVLREHVFDLRCSARSGTEQSREVLRAAAEELLEAERERWRQEWEAQRALSDAP